MLDECDRWLKKLAPGTLLYNINNPSWGFWLVYHAEVWQYPGSWTQVAVDVINPVACRLAKIDQEAGDFGDRWAIVDVSR
jgi:hypothetical protein